MMTVYGIKMQEDEIKGIRDYFINKYKSKEIPKSAFIELLATKFEKKSDAAEGRKALYDIRNRLEVLKSTP